MSMLKKRHEATPDVLEVVHHDVPDNAAGAGAAPIPARTYAEGGLTWRRMLRMVAVAETAGFAILLTATLLYGIDFFPPAAIAAVLFAVTAAWLPTMSKAGAIFGLVVSIVTLGFLGLFGITGFAYPTSWFEMSFATVSVLLPIAAVVAAIATLRRRGGVDAARMPSYITAGVCAAVVLVGLVGNVMANDATRLPGDLTLAASNIEFEQTSLTASAGDVAIYLENKDPFAHNVKIEGHGTSRTAAGNQSIRHVFRNLAAGTYAFVCAIHPDDMKGTLTVT